MSRFVRATIIALVVGILLFGASGAAYAAGGTVKNPSGQANGDLVNGQSFNVGISAVTPLATIPNGKLFVSVPNGNPHVIEMFFNAEGYSGDIPVKVCFKGQALGSVKVKTADAVYYLPTYLEDNKSCFQTWLGAGTTTFEYIP
jgi:hypothetical protein